MARSLTVPFTRVHDIPAGKKIGLTTYPSVENARRGTAHLEDRAIVNGSSSSFRNCDRNIFWISCWESFPPPPWAMRTCAYSVSG